MRNGIYRAWIKGPNGNSMGAVVLNDGDIFAVDPRFAFNGRYSVAAGRVTATIACTRLRCDMPSGHLPDLGHFHMRIAGPSGSEFAQTVVSIDEAPDFPLTLECAFLCEI